MKKILCILMTVILFLSVPTTVMAADAGTEHNYTVIPEKVIEPTTIRTRKQVEGQRLYIDEDNPVFMIRPSWGTGLSVKESVVKTYYALPEDIRNFTVIYVDDAPWKFSVEEQIAFWDELLEYTDRYNVPVFLQTECMSSNYMRNTLPYDELVRELKEHPSHMGYVQVELSTNGVTDNIANTDLEGSSFTEEKTGRYENMLNRMKQAAQACFECGAKFVWQDMEYIWREKKNFVNQFLDDEELYNMFKANSENVIIMDKRNGHGRHFASQSNIFGTWLDGVCGNWGINIENYIWYENCLTNYDEEGLPMSEKATAGKYLGRYPGALYGIDTIADMVGGATVLAFEGANNHCSMYAVENGEIVMTPNFYEALYPLYQLALNGGIPNKEQVKEKVKVAYKMNCKRTVALLGNEARLLQGLYADRITIFQEKFDPIYKDCSKDWVASTGRYYIVPILPIHSDAKEVLPNAKILTDFSYIFKGLCIPSIKTKYFNKQYEQTYTGNGTMYDINDTIFMFNSNESKVTDSTQTVTYKLPDNGNTLSASMEAHTYAIVKEDADSINIDLCNLRADSDKLVNGEENWVQYLHEYVNGNRRTDPSNYRTTTITLSGLSTEPKLTAEGTNNAKMSTKWDAASGTMTISVISNGLVTINAVTA